MAREAIFIGYRRDDTADAAGRIYDALANRFGRNRLFKDVDDLRPGADFGQHIRGLLPRCRVALILIGPEWSQLRDDNGRPRLEDPNDWVRVEVEIALATPGLDVVPVLVNGARMPLMEELPIGMQPLLRRHAAVIRRDPDFHDDIARLASALRSSVQTGILDVAGRAGDRRPALGAQAGARGRGLMRRSLVFVLAAALIGAVAWLVWIAPNKSPITAETEGAAVLPDARRLSSRTPAPVLRNESQIYTFGAFRDCRDCPDMVVLPSMQPNGPQFAVGRFEVTRGEFARYLQETGVTSSASGCWNDVTHVRVPDHNWANPGFSQTDNHPVVCVSWNDAKGFADWIGRRTGQTYRLMEGDEWTYATIAGRLHIGAPLTDQQAHEEGNYGFGDCVFSGGDPCAGSTLGRDVWQFTAPVGSFPPNPFGLFDTEANAREWTGYRSTYAGSENSRELRGGSWAGERPQDNRRHIMSTFATHYSYPQSPDYSYSSVGFRVARNISGFSPAPATEAPVAPADSSVPPSQ